MCFECFDTCASCSSPSILSTARVSQPSSSSGNSTQLFSLNSLSTARASQSSNSSGGSIRLFSLNSIIARPQQLVYNIRRTSGNSKTSSTHREAQPSLPHSCPRTGVSSEFRFFLQTLEPLDKSTANSHNSTIHCPIDSKIHELLHLVLLYHHFKFQENRTIASMFVTRATERTAESFRKYSV